MNFRGIKLNRGFRPDHPVQFVISNPAPYKLVTTQNLYICHATKPDCESIKDSINGNWFLKAFIETLALHAHNTEFDDLMRLTQYKLNKICTESDEDGDQTHQTIICEKRGVTKKFYMNIGFDPPIELAPYSTVIPKRLIVKLATSFGSSTPAIGTYEMNGKNRGVLFLVNNFDFIDPKMRRNGAEKDTELLLDLFNQMGFIIFYYENLNTPEFVNLAQQLSTSEYLQSADGLFFAVLTHGYQ